MKIQAKFLLSIVSAAVFFTLRDVVKPLRLAKRRHVPHMKKEQSSKGFQGT